MRCRALLNGRGEPFDLPAVAGRNTIETIAARDETRFAGNPLNAPHLRVRPRRECCNAAP